MCWHLFEPSHLGHLSLSKKSVTLLFFGIFYDDVIEPTSRSFKISPDPYFPPFQRFLLPSPHFPDPRISSIVLPIPRHRNPPRPARAGGGRADRPRRCEGRGDGGVSLSHGRGRCGPPAGPPPRGRRCGHMQTPAGPSPEQQFSIPAPEEGGFIAGRIRAHLSTPGLSTQEWAEEVGGVDPHDPFPPIFIFIIFVISIPTPFSHHKIFSPNNFQILCPRAMSFPSEAPPPHQQCPQGSAPRRPEP